MIDNRTTKVLKAIIRHCDVINDTIAFFGESFEDFEDNSIYQNALMTPVTQIGELVKRLPMDFRAEHSEIPWRNIAGMRDIVVHNYETIDKTILWSVALTEIPKIKSFCCKMIQNEVN